MDSWVNEYERLTQLASEISANIKEYHTMARANSSNTNAVKLSATIRRRLVQLTTDIAKLQDTLPQLNITEKEKNRRKDLIFNLATRKDQLSDLMSKPLDQVTISPTAAQLKNGAGASQTASPGGGRRAWGAQAKETEATRDMDNAQLLQYQKEQMKDQDETLDLLSTSVLKQKEIAVTINTELDVHNRILDDLDGKVGKTQAGIERERRHIAKVSESAKVGCMWVVIVVLIIVIVVFALTDWGCKIHDDPNRCS